MLTSAVNSMKFRPFIIGINDQTNGENGESGQTNCSGKTIKFLRGLILTTLISISWVGALYLMKVSFKFEDVSKDNKSDLNSHLISQQMNSNFTANNKSIEIKESQQIFDAPFFATWFCSLWNILFLPIFTLSQMCCNKQKDSTKQILIESIQGFMEKGFSLLQFFGRCGCFGLLWMITNYMIIYALRILDLTVVMAVFATSVSIVYLLSWVVLHQQFVGIRIVAVIICNTGIALLVYMDGVQHKTLGAVMVAFISAIGGAVYKVFFKRMIGYTTFAEMSLFFTLIGLMNAFLMWPLILLLYLFGAETIIWSQIPWTTLTGSAALCLMANIMGNFGIVWTYELFLNLGIFFAIPLASAIDTLIYKSEFHDMKLAGIILILFGFMVVLLPDNWGEYLANSLRQRLAKWKRREQIRKHPGQVEDSTTTGQLSRLRTNSGRVK